MTTRPRVRGERGRLRHSLRLRLTLLFVALALATTVVFLLGTQRALSGGWRDLVRPLVADYVDRLVADVGSPPDVARAQALTERLPISVRIDGPVVHWRSHPRDERDVQPHWGRAHDSSAWLFSRTTTDGHRITFGIGDVDWERRPRAIGWTTLAALLGLTLVAFGYTRHLFRPIEDIGAGAERFGRGDFTQPIPEPRHGELGELARRVNTMARDIERMLEAKRGLLLAISHELRSPLTRARLNAELVAPGAERDALLRDLGLMRDLIADLLESERLSGGAHAALQREVTDLNALVRSVVGDQAGERRVTLRLQEGLPELALDAARVRLALRNLLDNALRHGGDAREPPEIRTALDDRGVVLAVRDYGPGVADEHLPHLTEPFFRADAARARSTGGVGLGLTLCRLVATAHGGTLEARNANPGLEVALHLPPG